jgi:NDP-sugar pyrophosphorylase family protein
MISMGVYVYEPSALNYIDKGEYLDFPDLVQRMLADGRPVVGCPTDDYWMDLGSHADYAQAQAEFEMRRGSLLKTA